MAAEESVPATQPDPEVGQVLEDGSEGKDQTNVFGDNGDDDDAEEGAMKKPAGKSKVPKDKGDSEAPKAKAKGKGKAKPKVTPKATPKATGKPSPKAKGKGKGKGSQKGKVKGKGKNGLLKRPAAAVENDGKGGGEELIKKPAAKVAKKAAESFEVDFASQEHAPEDPVHEQGEEEDPVEDEEVEPETPDEARDRSKAKKFYGMLNKGSLPEAVKEAWSKYGNRKEQTQMINSLFKSDGRRLVIQDRFALPKQYQMEKAIQKKEKAHEQQEGFGKTIFMRKNALSEADLQACLDSGEVVSWRAQTGLTMYAATNQTFNQSAAKLSNEKLSSDAIKLCEGAGRAFASVWENIQPELASGSGGPAAPALANKANAEGGDRPAGLLRSHFKFGSCVSCVNMFLQLVSHAHAIVVFN